MAVQVGQGRSRSSPASPGAEKGENLGEGACSGFGSCFPCSAEGAGVLVTGSAVKYIPFHSHWK